METGKLQGGERCTLLDLTEESEFLAWDGMMGKDPVHLTGDGYAKLASGLMRMG